MMFTRHKEMLVAAAVVVGGIAATMIWKHESYRGEIYMETAGAIQAELLKRGAPTFLPAAIQVQLQDLLKEKAAGKLDQTHTGYRVVTMVSEIKAVSIPGEGSSLDCRASSWGIAKSGRHIQLDGQFCYDRDAERWRAVIGNLKYEGAIE